MASKDRITRALGALDEAERRQSGRLGALLLGVASALAIPAALALQPPPDASKHLVGLSGVLLSVALYLVPWGRLDARWLYLIPIIGTFEVTLGVLMFSDDFAFYQVLIAIWTAYAIDEDRVFGLFMGFFTASVVAPLAIGPESFSDQAHHVLVNLPVMLIAAGVVRYLRVVLTEREREYRRFAQEAVSLAERIRGPAAEEENTDLGLELGELAGRSREHQPS